MMSMQWIPNCLVSKINSRYLTRVNAFVTVCTGLSSVILLGSCGERVQEINITEKREQLDAYDVERFAMEVPAHWRRSPDKIPGKQFRNRLLSYQFGKNGGEIYVSYDVSGDFLSNANRWLSSVSAPHIEDANNLELIDAPGGKTYLIEAYGGKVDNRGSESKVARGDRGFLGVLSSEDYFGRYSVTMIGSAEEVREERQNFIQACKTLKYIAPQEVKDE